jgi:spore maturation protein A
MLNYIWLGLLFTGFVIGMINGRLDEVVEAAFKSSERAVEISIGLLGIICLWSGLMKIAEKSGVTSAIAFLFKPVLKLIFPQITKNKNALGAIVMNLAANFLGLGNAATPLGIKAMNELQKVNGGSDEASDSMCMFLVLNTSAIQLIPTTVIALRSDAGSSAPSEITVCVWIASICATITGIVMAKLFSRTHKFSKKVRMKR